MIVIMTRYSERITEGSGVLTQLVVPSMRQGIGRETVGGTAVLGGELCLGCPLAIQLRLSYLVLDVLAGAQGRVPAWREHSESPARGWCWKAPPSPEGDGKEVAVAASVWRSDGEEEWPGKWWEDQEHVWHGSLGKSVSRRGGHVSTVTSGLSRGGARGRTIGFSEMCLVGGLC